MILVSSWVDSSLFKVRKLADAARCLNGNGASTNSHLSKQYMDASILSQSSNNGKNLIDKKHLQRSSSSASARTFLNSSHNDSSHRTIKPSKVSTPSPTTPREHSLSSSPVKQLLSRTIQSDYRQRLKVITVGY